VACIAGIRKLDELLVVGAGAGRVPGGSGRLAGPGVAVQPIACGVQRQLERLEGIRRPPELEQEIAGIRAGKDEVLDAAVAAASR